MLVLVITDIWGRGSATDRWVLDLQKAGYEVLLLDPYEGQKRSFANETEAYTAFIECCGHEGYARRVESAVGQIAVQKPNSGLVLLGFSAGASAAWRVVGSGEKHGISHLIGFYPGQIRNNLGLSPGCPVTLIFPAAEDHFSVDDTISALREKQEVVCFKAEGAHGFLNPLSHNYCASEAQKYTDVICAEEKILIAFDVRNAIAELVGSIMSEEERASGS
ncbi:dienelactone hydrolase family protein [Kiloniella laminariae]|uniref:dienelactone hydrolase family protein n=1 Tax=Kiloniella laminariae TaxID=454162 RepID=UPI000379BC2B|nr:dienelactone hydrolase family protein [Kiloniella laminariae]